MNGILPVRSANDEVTLFFSLFSDAEASERARNAKAHDWIEVLVTVAPDEPAEQQASEREAVEVGVLHQVP